ncbi:MAG: TIGR03087 family PEP-CTERM/XrtA system glycosyltransferase [Planctomycetes bacterium]|nr:TIGR03087 family PEP-CTERM/XrtA system glycosyltransferase [Planctomycetota bacterium]
MTAPPRNVVFLSQRVPHPPDRGDRISTYHILRHLRETGCRVRVGCLSEDARDDRAIADLRGMIAEICAPRIDPRWRKVASLRGLLTGAPLTLPYFRHRTLGRTVDRWLSQDPPDVVFLYSSSMAQYATSHPGVRRVMHFAELDSDKWRQYADKSGPLGRWIYGREAERLLRFETAVAQTFDASLVVSEVERELFMRLIPSVEPVVVPNGVDVDHFASKGDEQREPHTIVFTGVMDYEPNVDGVLWFADTCWPRIRARHPDARFLVVGSRPIPRIRQLGERGDGIEITGWVEATPPYFDRATVAIAPLRLARGLQNKVLEAMSMGLPVVASPQAAQGLGSVGPDTLRIAADADALATEVLALLDDPAAARAIGSRAARWVREHFRWEHMFARLDAVFDRVTRPGHGSPA